MYVNNKMRFINIYIYTSIYVVEFPSVASVVAYVVSRNPTQVVYIWQNWYVCLNLFDYTTKKRPKRDLKMETSKIGQ